MIFFFQKIEPIDFKIALNDCQAEKIKKFGEVAMYQRKRDTCFLLMKSRKNINFKEKKSLILSKTNKESSYLN